MRNIDINQIFQWPLKKQSIIFVTIFLLVFLVGYYWDITALKVNLQKVGQEELDLKEQLQMVIKKEADLKHELTSEPKIKAILTEWKSKLINPKNLSTLMNDILKIGADNHIFFTLFNPTPEIASDKYHKIPVKVIAVGSYNQLAAFISQVANMPYLVVINQFTFSNENKADVLGAKLANQANAANLLTAEMILEIYLSTPFEPLSQEPAKT